MNVFIVVSLLVITSLVIIGLLIWRIRELYKIKVGLQQKISVVESEIETLVNRLSIVEKQQKEELSQDQITYRNKIKAQYANLFQQIKDTFEAEIKTVKAEAVIAVQKCKTDFDNLLKTEFEEACEKIQFNEIEYKKTITKKRREYNHKNSHKAKPQRIWRSITED